MGTRAQFIATAMNDLGYAESPPSSNHTKFGEWIGLQNQPWCMSAVQYWADKANVQLPVLTGSCTMLMLAAQKDKSWFTKDFMLGDVLIFRFKNNSANPSPKYFYHTGILTGIYDDYVETIEGNTSVGNDANGGCVMLRRRRYSCIMGAVRPEFTEEEKEMTYEQFVVYMQQYRQSLRDNDADEYSKEARDWAVSQGLINGNGEINGEPNFMWADFLSREQFLTILYRYDQLRNQQPME